jgi:pyruvate dehydrogenase E2 component (dihydrolipoamide acetyltransferase)
MVSEWFVQDGGQVKKGEMVYSLETEKVNLDVDSDYTGTVKHLVEVGVTLEPGDVVGYIFEAGEDIPETLAGSPAAASEAELSVRESSVETAPEPVIAQVAAPSAGGHIKSSPAARRLAKELGVDYTQVAGTGPGGRIVEADIQAASQSGAAVSEAPAVIATGPEPKASPIAKRLASERGVDLRNVQGTGPGGRIVQSDIENAAITSAAAVAVSGPRAGEKVPVKGMRKTIAARMHQSLQESAQLTMDMEVNMDDVVKMRSSLVEEWANEGVKPTYTDIVMKAVAKALHAHPMMNSQFLGAEIALMTEINVGMAVALPEGLVVPVVRNVDQLSIKELARETSRLAVAARGGTLGLDDYAGGTFTVTALGMYGVDSFTPIINQPQTGIMGVNRIFDGVEWSGEKPVKTKKMNLSLTWDHRAVDGAPAAEYLVEVRNLLQSPYRLLV